MTEEAWLASAEAVYAQAEMAEATAVLNLAAAEYDRAVGEQHAAHHAALYLLRDGFACLLQHSQGRARVLRLCMNFVGQLPPPDRRAKLLAARGSMSFIGLRPLSFSWHAWRRAAARSRRISRNVIHRGEMRALRQWLASCAAANHARATRRSAILRWRDIVVARVWSAWTRACTERSLALRRVAIAIQRLIHRTTLRALITWTAEAASRAKRLRKARAFFARLVFAQTLVATRAWQAAAAAMRTIGHGMRTWTRRGLARAWLAWRSHVASVVRRLTLVNKAACHVACGGIVGRAWSSWRASASERGLMLEMGRLAGCRMLRVALARGLRGWHGYVVSRAQSQAIIDGTLIRWGKRHAVRSLRTWRGLTDKLRLVARGLRLLRARSLSRGWCSWRAHSLKARQHLRALARLRADPRIARVWSTWAARAKTQSKRLMSTRVAAARIFYRRAWRGWRRWRSWYVERGAALTKLLRGLGAFASRQRARAVRSWRSNAARWLLASKRAYVAAQHVLQHDLGRAIHQWIAWFERREQVIMLHRRSASGAKQPQLRRAFSGWADAVVDTVAHDSMLKRAEAYWTRLQPDRAWRKLVAAAVACALPYRRFQLST